MDDKLIKQRASAEQIAEEALPCWQAICDYPRTPHADGCPARHHVTVAAAIAARDRSWEEELRALETKLSDLEGIDTFCDHAHASLLKLQDDYDALRAELQAKGPCGKHPKACMETPKEAWARASSAGNDENGVDTGDYSGKCRWCAELQRERELLLEGFNIISSAHAHVSHGGPTREEASAWIKKAEEVLKGKV